MNIMRCASALGLVLLAACASAPEAQAPLPGTKWKLAAADRGPLASLAADSGITIAFEADRLSGNGGCNQYSGNYSIEGATLKIGPVVATKRACVGSGNDAERAWFAVLAQPVAHARADGTLVLRESDGAEYRFVPATD